MTSPLATIDFYDIASGPPVRPYAPNPWKARYSLNFKNASYRTQWVELPDVVATRKSLGAAPVRKFHDGTDFYTLPVIKNLKTGEVVGDSFDIAVYLDELYPDQPRLFPPGSKGLMKTWNTSADLLFGYTFVALCVENMPFNPENAHISKAEFCRRAGKKSWDELHLTDEQRKKLMEEFEVATRELVKSYVYGNGREEDLGPWLNGEQPTYADIIIGGWLQFYNNTLKPEEWEQLSGWHGGLFGRIHAALQQFTQVN